MMDTLLQYYATFIELSQKNMIMSGAIGVGVGAFFWGFLRGLPAKLYALLHNQLVVSLALSNTNSQYNEKNFNLFSQWVVSQPLANWSRRFTANQTDLYLDNGKDRNDALGLGLGLHFFMFKGRLCWFVKTRLDSSGAMNDKQDIVINILTRNREMATELFQTFCWKPREEGLTVTHWEGMRWGNCVEITKRELSTVILNKDIKQGLLTRIDQFYTSRNWYDDRGLPYKYTVLLHGPTGTGKSSIAKAIASNYNRNVSVLSLASMTNETLRRAVNTMPKGNILLIEDFEDAAAVKDRTLLDPVKAKVALASLIKANNIVDVSNHHSLVDWNMDITGQVAYLVDNVFVCFNPNDGIGIPFSSSIIRENGWDEVGDDGDYERIKDIVTRYIQLKSVKEPVASNDGMLTLSGLLNTLDGIVPLDGTLVIMTTNHPENMDSALLRKGRVDYQAEIPWLEDTEIRDYFKLMFPEYVVPTNVVFKPVPGCNIMAAYKDNLDDPTALFEVLEKVQLVEQKEQSREGIALGN